MSRVARDAIVRWSHAAIARFDCAAGPGGTGFTASAPNETWVADITYVPTWAGFLYLAVVLDVYSRRVIGWAMKNHLRTDLVLSALDMAVHVGGRPRE